MKKSEYFLTKSRFLVLIFQRPYQVPSVDNIPTRFLVLILQLSCQVPSVDIPTPVPSVDIPTFLTDVIHPWKGWFQPFDVIHLCNIFCNMWPCRLASDCVFSLHERQAALCVHRAACPISLQANFPVLRTYLHDDTNSLMMTLVWTYTLLNPIMSWMRQCPISSHVMPPCVEYHFSLSNF